MEFSTNAPVIPQYYVLTTGNNNATKTGRNPKDWIIRARANEEDEWTTIANVVDDRKLQDVNYTAYTFAFDNSDNNAYRYFQFEVTANKGADEMQLSELKLWVKNTIVLADNSDNSTMLDTYKNKTVSSVTLSGRKLWKDGDWNTLCLPFAVNDFNNTPLEGATVKTLESASFSGGTLTLNFSENSLTAIESGKPYIVKWTTTGDPIENPKFNNVTIDNTSRDIVTDAVTFTGTYSPVAFTATDKSVLFLGGDNTLYYPDPALKDPNAAYDAANNPYIPVTIGCQRAYFQLNGITASPNPSEGGEHVRTFVLNFGDGETNGIVDAEENSHLSPLTPHLSVWYTLDGRRLNGKPTRRGIYVNHGKKVVIM